LLVGCANFRSPNARVAAEASPAKARSANEAQGAIQRIDAVRDQAQCAQALSLWQQGKSAESRQLLEQVLARTPDQREARRLLADLALEAGEVQQAEQLLLRLIDDHPDDTAAQAALAWLYESQGREGEAQMLFKQIDEAFSPGA
jgi:predicted Zn-dependent protease